MSDATPTPYVVARLREALAHDARVAALDIQIRIVGSDVFLTGAVATPARRDAIDAVVHEVAPELLVHNQLDVLPAGAPPGHEEIR
jgi:osmotically-inducible protein OsmY